MPYLRRSIAALLAVAALAAASAAVAAMPQLGHFSGSDGVGSVVVHSPHGTPTVEQARYHARASFEPAFVHGAR